MGNIEYISYSEWISLIASVRKKGLACEEINVLSRVYPHSVGEAYDSLIYNQLAKLEEYMIKEALNVFQKRMSMSLEEMDIEIAEMAFVRLKKHFMKCMFFLQIPDYPESVKRNMSDEIKKNMDSFLESFSKYIKAIEYEGNSSFIQEYVYISKKNLRKIKNMY